VSADQLCSLMHDLHAEITTAAIGDRLHIEAATIVTDAESHASGVEVQGNINAICVRVLDCIVDCFLPDAQEICLDRQWQRAEQTRHLDDSLDVVLSGKTFRRVAKRGG
jgi:hypothetical protein